MFDDSLPKIWRMFGAGTCWPVHADLTQPSRGGGGGDASIRFLLL
jgi:hypothetical protein